MAVNLKQFEALLLHLMSPDNSVRGQAEVTWGKAIRQSPDQLVILLLQIIRTSTVNSVLVSLILTSPDPFRTL